MLPKDHADVHALHTFVTSLNNTAFNKIAPQYFNTSNPYYDAWLLHYTEYHIEQCQHQKIWMNHGVFQRLLKVLHKNPDKVQTLTSVFHNIFTSEDKMKHFARQLKAIFKVLLRTYREVEQFPQVLQRDPLVQYFKENKHSEVVNEYAVQKNTLLCFFHPYWKRRIYYINDKSLYEQYMKNKETLTALLSPEENHLLESSVFMYESMQVSLVKSLENVQTVASSELDIMI